MPSDVVAFVDDLSKLIHAGIDHHSVSRLQRHAADLRSEGESAAADTLERSIAAEPDETPIALLDVTSEAFVIRAGLADLSEVDGELEDIEEGGFWQTPMPAETLYLLVPETRPFAKRAKPPEQVEALEAAARRGQAADLRLLQLYLRHLNEKAGSVLGDAVAQSALPAFGPTVLDDLWQGMTPESRHFIAAYKINVGATLARLLEKPTKRGDKSGSVMKAVERLMESVTGGTAAVSPETLPILRLALKHAPEAGFRRKIAELIVSIGPAAEVALPELIDAFEHGGLTRDYQLVRPLIVLGKESQEVADVLIRALEDRDASVRLLAAFNLGLMGKPALGALPALEEVLQSDTDAKVREQAAKTVNKLRLRLEPAPVGLHEPPHS